MVRANDRSMWCTEPLAEYCLGVPRDLPLAIAEFEGLESAFKLPAIGTMPMLSVH